MAYVLPGHSGLGDAAAGRPRRPAAGRADLRAGRRRTTDRPDRPYRAWHDLHRDLSRLSANSRHVVSESSAHYLNDGDPELVIAAIRDVVRAARDGAPLAEPAAAVVAAVAAVAAVADAE